MANAVRMWGDSGLQISFILVSFGPTWGEGEASTSVVQPWTSWALPYSAVAPDLFQI